MNEEIIKNYGQYIIIVETVVILLLLLWNFFFSNDNSEVIKELERENHGLKKQLAKIKLQLQDIEKSQEMPKTDLKHGVACREQKTKLHVTQEQDSNIIVFDLSREHEQKVSASRVSYRFLQEANNGKFLKAFQNPEKCFFRTWEESGVRKFEFCGNVAKALANINAIFDDVCEIEGKRSGASDIENVAAGILDSELRIISKAKIKLK